MKQIDHSYWMQKAIDIADEGSTPFGALIVNKNGDFISAYNTTKQDGATAHAEINVIRKIDQLEFQNSKELTLYSTVEPCPMCMGAIVWSGISKVTYGATIGDASEFGRQIDITCQEVADNSWYDIEVNPYVEREACLKLFKNEIEKTADI